MSNDIVSPLVNVKRSCEYVCSTAAHVSILDHGLEKVAADMSISDFELLREGVSWDADGWHYSKDANELGPITCQYIFVMDSLNFCFWPCPGLEYEQLAVNLRNVVSNIHFNQEITWLTDSNE